MGHLLFLLLHVVALVLGAVLLFVTIPAHLIYIAIKRRPVDPHAPTPDTHVKCPDCRELVLRDATVCKHCRCRLVPQ